jgi:hypothetical protein
LEGIQWNRRVANLPLVWTMYARAAPAQNQKWVQLFNGKTLDG